MTDIVIDNTNILVFLRVDVLYSLSQYDIKIDIPNIKICRKKYIECVPYTQVDLYDIVPIYLPPYTYTHIHEHNTLVDTNNFRTQLLLNNMQSASCKFTKNKDITKIYEQNKYINMLIESKSHTSISINDLLNMLVINSIIIEFQSLTSFFSNINPSYKFNLSNSQIMKPKFEICKKMFNKDTINDLTKFIKNKIEGIRKLFNKHNHYLTEIDFIQFAEIFEVLNIICFRLSTITQ